MDKDWNKDQQTKDSRPADQKESLQNRFNRSSNKFQRKPGEEAGKKEQANRSEGESRERTQSQSGRPDYRDQRDQKTGSGSESQQ
ncbi:MAG TPA: hypothetical protein VEU97_05095 [Ktedonobacteraceae bacterium]|nr:hypothetical protein [Ktedonobacteraceae bacterium]